MSPFCEENRLILYLKILSVICYAKHTELAGDKSVKKSPKCSPDVSGRVQNYFFALVLRTSKHPPPNGVELFMDNFDFLTLDLSMSQTPPRIGVNFS